MGYSTPGGQGLQFPFELLPEGENYRLKLRVDRVPIFNDLELYLMGLLPPEAVGKHFVFNDQSQQPRAGGLLLGPIREVSIGDLVAVVGPRDPPFAASQKSFRIATIVISDELLPAEAVSFYDFFARRAELREAVPYSSGLERGVAKPFFVSTGGRGEISTRLEHESLGPKFQRGDANPDGQLDLSDGVSILSFLFLSGEPPACLASADCDDSGQLDLTDPIYLLNYLFLGATPPPPPFGACGRAAGDGGPGCGSYAPCR